MEKEFPTQILDDHLDILAEQNKLLIKIVNSLDELRSRIEKLEVANNTHLPTINESSPHVKIRLNSTKALSDYLEKRSIDIKNVKHSAEDINAKV